MSCKIVEHDWIMRRKHTTFLPEVIRIKIDSPETPISVLLPITAATFNAY